MSHALVGRAHAWLAAMTLEQKAGQAMCVGFDGTALSPELRSLIEELHVGGLIYFERNVASRAALARLSADLQAVAQDTRHPALLLAIDQEGGRVTRLRRSAGFSEFPSSWDVAAAGGPAAVRQVAAAMAAELREVGVNVNLAPVLDVNSNPDNPIINTRSFSSDPQMVAACGVAFVEATQEAGILAMGKHFPGHGDTTVDSHVTLPVVPHGRERLDAVELAPFRAAIAAGVGGIMSAHVWMPAIDPTPNCPATLSRRVLVDLLRRELGFDGLIFTDALEMGALAAAGYPPPTAAVAALAAGADVLLFNVEASILCQAHRAIVGAVQDGSLDPARLDDAVLRVLAAKARLGLL